MGRGRELELTGSDETRNAAEEEEQSGLNWSPEEALRNHLGASRLVASASRLVASASCLVASSSLVLVVW